MRPESDFTTRHDYLPQEKLKLWSAPDPFASEVEVSEFVGALVRLLKPELVVETGCYKGDTTLAIAKALQANEYGYLRTCDTDEQMVAATLQRAQEAGLNQFVYAYHWRGVDLIRYLELLLTAKDKIDLAFLDSSTGSTRAEEFEALLPIMRPRGIIAVHDTAPQHDVWKHFAQKIAAPHVFVYLNTPRGLTLIQV